MPHTSPSELAELRAKVAALQELLGVHEDVVMEQSGQLEQALAALRLLNTQLEARVRARTLELSAANRALTEQAERWRVTLASIGDGVIVTDRHGVVVTVNDTAEQLTGWSMTEATGRHLDEVFVAVNEDTGLAAENPAARALREGVIVGLANHTVLVARDGSRRPVDDSAAPIIDESNNVLGVVFVFRDITDRRRLERSREDALHRERDARCRSETLNRAKDDFLSVLSHELRTPLTAILGWTAMMRTCRLDAHKMRKAIDVIERSANVQLRLVTDLLDMSSMLAGKLTLQKHPVDLWELTQATLEASRPAAVAAGVHLAAHTADEALIVDGDSQRLQQIVQNLIDNAIKFTLRGGRVNVSLSRRGETAVIAVEDSGIGIEPDFLPYLFDRFSQADSTIRRHYRGLGLGLSLVRRLVGLHGGSIEARSAGPGRGSTFVVSLPLALSEPEPATESGAAAPADALKAAPLDDLRVLLVEDDEDTRDMIIECLQRLGARTASAANATEALELLDRFHPDLMIGDIGLPGMDGFELMRSIRARSPECGGATPALALTAYVSPEDRARAIDCGYQMHVSKPVDLTVLVGSIRELAQSDR